MFSVDENECSVCFKASSEMKLVDRMVKETREFLSGLSDEEFSSIKLVMRELLINAVEHGSGKLPSMPVKCLLERLGDDRFKICVEDEGPGFDWRKVNLSLPDSPKNIRNRGYPLINALSDAIEFEGRGNAVTAYLTIARETDYGLSEADGACLISPTGDITAASSYKLKSILLEQLDAGRRRFKFDFARVKDIDSVGLSALMALARMLEESLNSKPDLEIVNAPEEIVRLFEMTMLDTVFKFSSGQTCQTA